jgi:dihydroflavonol-4-reductase
VTGGTGFLGYHIVGQLRNLGAKVRVLALAPRRPHPLPRRADVTCCFGNVLDRGLVRSAVRGCDVIFHTAGVVALWGQAVKQMNAVHVQGTQNVLDAADPHALVVHTSSVVTVAASYHGTVATEDSPFDLDGCGIDYVLTKRAAEKVALAAAAHGQRVVVTNPGHLVGPEDYERSVMARFCLRCWKGRIPLAPPGGINVADVRDVARGHLLAAEHGQPGQRYILAGENLLWRDLIVLLSSVHGLRPRAVPRLPGWLLGTLAALGEARAWLTRSEPYPSWQSARFNRYYWFFRSDRAAEELGYLSRPVAEALADARAWFADAVGKLPPHSLRGLNRWWMRPFEPRTEASDSILLPHVACSEGSPLGGARGFDCKRVSVGNGARP